MRGLVLVVLAGLASVPVWTAGADPASPAGACQAADAALPGAWYEFCVGQTALRSKPEIRYAQDTVGCTTAPLQCTYRPTFHASLETLGAGEWRVDATSRMLNYPGFSPVAGSARSVSCAVAQLATSCASSAENLPLTAGNFNAYRWEGGWALYLRDATGADRLMATGSASGWLAQYYSG